MGNEASSTGSSSTSTTTNNIPQVEEDPSSTTTTTSSPPPTEDTSLLSRVRNSLSGLTTTASQPPPSESWIKMPIGAKTALGEASTALSQSQSNPCPCLEMTYSQRFIAFLICFSVGTVLSVISTMNVPSIVLKPSRFAIPFTLGNIISLLSMSFLIGFKKQCSSLFHKDRALASSVFIASMVGTIVASVILHSALLCFAFIIIQYSAYIWYCASYIPYGRSFLLGCGKKCWSCIT